MSAERMASTRRVADRRAVEGLQTSVLADRRRAIELLVGDRGAISVAQLAAIFGVSTVTIRSDLKALASTGAVRRFHGGALGDA